MSMFRVRDLAKAAGGYLRRNPDEVVRAILSARGGRFGLPLAALRWFAEQLPTGRGMPKDVELLASPPALRFGMTIDAMGTPIRASGKLFVESVYVTAESCRLTCRVENLKLEVIGDAESPVAMLIRSGALDVSKPGEMLKYLPKRPPFLVEAEGERIALDLLKIPKLAENTRFRRALRVITPVLTITGIETDFDHLYVKLEGAARRLPEAFAELRRPRS